MTARFEQAFAEASNWKYNERENPNAFATFLRGVFS